MALAFYYVTYYIINSRATAQAVPWIERMERGFHAMRMKKWMSTGLVCALCAVLLTVTALACGHGHGRGASGQIGVCPYDSCTTGGRHTHGGVTYCGYAHESGYCDGNCHALCAVEDCTVVGRHTHDGVTYCGFDHEGGFCNGTCYALCAVEGCTVTGRHTHGGVTYCGNHHGCGYCDGGCAVSQGRRHHGGCHS